MLRKGWGKSYYQEVFLYAEQLICSFKKRRQIILAWNECVIVLPERANVHKVLKKVLHSLNDQNEQMSLEFAMEQVEQEYPCKAIYMIHRLLRQMEMCEAVDDSVLDLFLEEIWICRNYRKNSFWNCVERKKYISWEEEFFLWLLSLAIYLERDNVYGILQKVCFDVGEEFQNEVNKLMENLYEMPDSYVPYMHFFEDKHIPIVESAKRLIYLANTENKKSIQKKLCLLVKEAFWKQRKQEENRKQKKKKIRSYLGNFILVICFFFIFGISIFTMNQSVNYGKAKTYYENVRTRLEEQSLSKEAMEACKKEAWNRGYELNVTTYGTSGRDARITLTYYYHIPIVGFHRKYVIDGYAR